MNKLTIDRSSWRFGGERYDEKFGETLLRNSDNGMMCCLGFESLRCGIDIEYLNAISMPYELGVVAQNKAPHLVRKDTYDKLCSSVFTNDAIEINDSEIENEIRESRLIELFKEHDIELTFEGEYLNGD